MMRKWMQDHVGTAFHWGRPAFVRLQRVLAAVAITTGCGLALSLTWALGSGADPDVRKALIGLGLALLGSAGVAWTGLVRESDGGWVLHLASGCLVAAVALGLASAGGAGSGLGVLYAALAAYANYTYGALSGFGVLLLAGLQLLPALAAGTAGEVGHVLVALTITAAWIPAGARWNALHRNSRQLTRYLAAVRATTEILAKLDLDETLAATADQVVAATGADQCVIFLADEELQLLRPRVVRLDPRLYQAADHQAWQHLVIHYGEGMAGWVASHGQAILTGDAERDPRAKHVPGTDFADESALVIPMLAEDRLVGVVRATRAGLNRFSTEDLRLLQVLGAGAAVAIAHARLYREARRQAVTDPLTGLYNRHYFNTSIEPQLVRESEAGVTLSVLMIDLYDFKAVNDTWGHAAGDVMLKRVAELLLQHVRATDLVVRYGGDEFVVVMPQTGRAEAETVKQRIESAVASENRRLRADEPRMQLSIGVDASAGGDLAQLLNRADAAMYAMKRSRDRRRLV